MTQLGTWSDQADRLIARQEASNLDANTVLERHLRRAEAELAARLNRECFDDE